MQVLIVIELIQLEYSCIELFLCHNQTQFVNRSVVLSVSCFDCHFSDKGVVSRVGANKTCHYPFTSFVFGIQLQYKITGLDVVSHAKPLVPR